MTYSVALAQVNPVCGDLEYNVKLHIAQAEQALEVGAAMIVFPELSLTGYSLKDQTLDIMRHADCPEFAGLRALSRHIAVCAGFVEEGGDGIPYNSAFFMDKGEIQHVHRKMYLPTHGMFEELKFLGHGRELSVFDTRFGRAGIVICRDLFHPLEVSTMASLGVELLLAPSSIPARGFSGEELAIEHTVGLALGSASTFLGMFVVYVNRVGFDDGLGFYGGSALSDPVGGITVSAPRFETAQVLGTIDTSHIARRRYQLPILREENLEIVRHALETRRDS
ncbi:MAG TPA: nitrilase-related carbon-nitrogen hydrolase [Clostridia bacterium]|nr:nitrilase-related carbon-nitrogen hydrolase [Clostridia bacterium]